MVFTALELYFGGKSLGKELLDIYPSELMFFLQNIEGGKSDIVVRILVHGLASWAIVGTGGPRRQIPQMFVYRLAPCTEFMDPAGTSASQYLFTERQQMHNKYQNKLPKGSQIECFLETVVHRS